MGVPDRAAATVASALLEDLGVVTHDDMSNGFIDRHKIRRERIKNRMERRVQDFNEFATKNMKGLYFDGRKDQTLCQKDMHGTLYQHRLLEEHVTLIEEPDCKYLGHVSPKTSSAKDMTESITNFFKEHRIDINTLLALGADGTAVNTGYKGGVFRRIEQFCKKSLHWFVCQLHGNELLLKHLMQHFDGKTTGPKTFIGPIGKQLQNCELLPVVNFKKIETTLPSVEKTNLSTDQRYLRDICIAVTNGVCSENLSKKNPGNMSHARWLTTANRILRFYISTQAPSHELQALAEFIMKVYAPAWFTIKSHPNCTDGPRNLWKTIAATRYLSDDIKVVVYKVIQRNGYFAHPEAIFLAMLVDPDKNVRELALRRIMKARKETGPDVRVFKIPKLKFNAKSYVDLIYWQNCQLTEPPITTNLSNEEILRLIKSGECPELGNINFPCHTQCIERGVKLTTEASLAVIGETRRDGYIRSRIESRSVMPSFETKSQYRVKNM